MPDIEEEFESSYEETSSHRIKMIFYYLKAVNVIITITYDDLIYQAEVIEITDEFIRFDVPEFKESQTRKAIMTFEVLNRYYMTRIFVDKFNEDGMFISLPDSLFHLARRMYPRINFTDLFTRFIILYSPILHEKREERNIESRYPHFLTEILNDNPSLNVIYKMTNTELSKISEDYEIVMTYNKEELTVEEKYMYQADKNLLINDVSEMESYIEKIDDDSVTNFYDYYQDLVKEKGDYEALIEFEEMKKKDARNFLVSYLLVPFKLFDTYIGYFRLETNQFAKKFISIAQANEVAMIAELFSYAITKVRIRNSHFDPSSRRTRILNLSQSGMLIEITDQVLYEYLKRHVRVKLLIPYEETELEIYGEINRYFPRDGAYYMGILFFKSKPDDMKYLEKFIYENIVEDLQSLAIAI